MPRHANPSGCHAQVSRPARRPGGQRDCGNHSHASSWSDRLSRPGRREDWMRSGRPRLRVLLDRPGIGPGRAHSRAAAVFVRQGVAGSGNHRVLLPLPARQLSNAFDGQAEALIPPYRIGSRGILLWPKRTLRRPPCLKRAAQNSSAWLYSALVSCAIWSWRYCRLRIATLTGSRRRKSSTRVTADSYTPL